MSYNSFLDEVLPGIDNKINPAQLANLFRLHANKFPMGFPTAQWVEAQVRFAWAWWWWSGRGLEETKGKDGDGDPIFVYPLKINTIRSYSRVHNNMLWGETKDDPNPIVRSRVKPMSFWEDKPTEQDRKEAAYYERLLEQMWYQSKDRAILREAGLNSQYLGGSYLQIKYQPWRTDAVLPLFVVPLKADFVMPVWGDDPWELLEVWISYRMTPVAAEHELGVKRGDNPLGKAPAVTYVEHWTRQNYSIWVDDKPLTATYFTDDGDKVTVSYNNQPNPFGVVPVVYIPRERSGEFYGNSVVPDILGMMKELNARLADVGDAISENTHRVWVGRNITRNINFKQLSNGQRYIDIGSDNPVSKHPPELTPQDPPKFSPEMTGFNNEVRSEMEREGQITPIAFGIDEGSQRSGETLDQRMWPTVSSARSQRDFWTVGINQVNTYALLMLSRLNVALPGPKVAPDFRKRFRLWTQWNPFLPKNVEQETNRIVALKSNGSMSTRRAVESQSDVEDVDTELAYIREDEAAKTPQPSGVNQYGVPSDDSATPGSADDAAERLARTEQQPER